jgi:hypothetical protein
MMIQTESMREILNDLQIVHISFSSMNNRGKLPQNSKRGVDTNHKIRNPIALVTSMILLLMKTQRLLSSL